MARKLLLVLLVLYSVAGVAQKPVPQLPQTYIDTTFNAPTGVTWAVHTSTSFQSALNSANPGDKIVLDAGAIYEGNFTLPVKSNPNNQWIYIVSSALSSLPAPGNRVSPAAAAKMPKITSTNVTAPLKFDAGANHYRLVGLEVYGSSTTGCKPTATPPQNCYGYELIASGTAIGKPLVDSITIDRCYVHGQPDIDQQRGVTLNGSNYALIDSYVSDIHMQGIDVQAVGAWLTPGPVKIVNNYLEGAGENIIFGGAGGLNNPYVPSDLEIRNNWLNKPMAWAHVGISIPPNNTIVVKNLFELKSARRVLVDGNLMENNWVSGQGGFAVAFTPRTNAIGGSGLLAVVDDITFSNNILKNVSSGFSILATDGPPNCVPSKGCTSVGELRRVVIKNNLILLGDTTQPGYTNGSAWGGQLLPASTGITDVVFQHNTFIGPPNLGYCRQSIYIDTVHPWMPGSATHNLWIIDNALCRQIFGARGWMGSSPTVITDYMGDPSTPPNGVVQRFKGNVMYVPPGDKVQGYPPHNFASDKKLTSSNGDEYQLKYPAKMETTDGQVPGVDKSKLASAYSAESGTQLPARSELSTGPPQPKQ